MTDRHRKSAIYITQQYFVNVRSRFEGKNGEIKRYAKN